MNINKLLLAILAPLLFYSCSQQGLGPAYNDVNSEEGFVFSLPENLSRTNELHDFAGLQFANQQEGVYLIGIAEAKDKLHNLHLYYTLDDYAHVINRKVGMGLDTFTVSLKHSMEVDSMACVSSDIFGEIYGGEEPLKVYYNVSVFEDDDYFYQLVCWTDRDLLPQFKSEFEKIVCSVQSPLSRAVELATEERGAGGEGVSE